MKLFLGRTVLVLTILLNGLIPEPHAIASQSLVLTSAPARHLRQAETYNEFVGSRSTSVFVGVGGMSRPRSGHTATLLEDGRVLIAGGWNEEAQGLATAEIYNPLTKRFTPTGNLTPRYRHSATRLQDGKVLIVGGYFSSGGTTGLLSSAELYDPATGFFTDVGSLSLGRYDHTATLLESGEVLIVGGVTANGPTASAAIYDPQTQTFSDISSLQDNRYQHTATVLSDGRVLILGGRRDNQALVQIVEIFDPATRLFSRTANIPVGRFQHSTTLLADGQVLLAGGYGQQNGQWVRLSDAWRYRPSTGEFLSLTPMGGVRAEHAALRLPDGRVLVAGGKASDTNFLATTEVYNPLSRQFTANEEMQVPRSGHTATLLDDGTVLMVGGQISPTGHTASAEIGNLLPANTMTGTLLLPSGWVTSTTVNLAVIAESLAAPVTGAALSHDGVLYGNWLTISNSVALSTTWSALTEGLAQEIHLRLRDSNGQTLDVVTGTVDVDSLPPQTTMSPLPPISPKEFTLEWSATDNLSGVDTYDVDYRVDNGPWEPLLTSTTVTTTTFTGEYDTPYAFRVRTKDVAGNVEPWPVDANVTTRVFAPVNASFTGSPRSGPDPLTVVFTNTTTGDILSALWSFGDGGTSTQIHPTHTYTIPGPYTVTLQIADLESSQIVTEPNYIDVYAQVNAQFEASPTSGLYPLTVNFTNLSTGDYSDLLWDFGNGTQSTLANPTNTYYVPGVYTVTLQVSGLGGVDTQVNAEYISVYEPVVADFSIENDTGIASHAVTFTNLSTGSFDSLLWDFGDTGQSILSHPVYTYTTPGVYTVTLTAAGGGGIDTITKTNAITIYGPVSVDFTAAPTVSIAPANIQFLNQSTGDFDTVLWDFGNGIQSDQLNPAVTFTSSGSYTVSLQATGLGGADVLTKSNYIRIYTPVSARFEATPTVGIAPLSVSFTNTSSGDYTSSRWNYGDGFQTTLPNPSHIYNNSGVYTVSLQVSGSGGTNTITQTNFITVYGRVNADFTAKQQIGGAPFTAEFVNQSTGDYDTIRWDFGDGSEGSSLADPVHVYQSPGVYTVTLTLSGNGGEDTVVSPNFIQVVDKVFAGFSASPTQGIAPLAVTFTNQSQGAYDSLLWEFGDGSTSTQLNPVHTYGSGTFSVRLTARGPGGEDVVFKERYIRVTSRLYLPLLVAP
jgi:PKD repeat protein